MISSRYFTVRCRNCSFTLFYKFDLECNRIGRIERTPVPGTPLYVEMTQAGRVTDRDWGLYDYRHVVFRPTQMTAAELQAGADWLYAQFYRLDRILYRFARAVFTIGWIPAFLALKLGLTYRYDNKREGIVGRNPARREPVPLSITRAEPWPSPAPTRSC